MSSLIVTADDVGLHRGMTEGAIRAHRDGIVTSCSIVANGRAFDDAVQRLRDVPELEAGVHLTLVEEQSLTGIALPEKYPAFIAAFLKGRITIGQIEDEMRAQIEKVTATGLRVTHVNGHQHLHLLARIFEIVLKLAEEYGIGYIRIVDDRGGRGKTARRFAVAGLNFLGRRARTRATANLKLAAEEGVRKAAATPVTNHGTIGVMEAGHLIDLEHLLDHVDGVTELVTHPGIDVDAYPHWQYDWEGETRALCAPGLRDAIWQRGISLTTPSAVAATRR